MALVSTGARAQDGQPAAVKPAGEPGFVIDKIIAKVDNYIVLKSDLEKTYQAYLTSGGAPSEKQKCNLLNRLVINKLLVAKAEIDSVLLTDAEVDQNTDQRVSILLSERQNSVEELEKYWGKSMEDIKSDVRETIREQLLGREMTTKITKEITITPAEVKRFIGKVPVDSLPYYSSDVEVAQIVRIPVVSTKAKNDAIKKLVDLRGQILAGADFNVLAKKYSEDPSAQQNGGELGKAGRGMMASEFEATAFRLKDGEISMPFKTAFGYHIMQLINRNGNEYTSRHILIMASPSEDDMKHAERYLDSLRHKILKDSIKFGEAARFFSDDKNTKDHGGFITDAEGGTRVSLEELDPTIYFAINDLKPGEITKPLPYRTDDNKQAMRILFKKAMIAPHKANLNDDWFRLQAGALAEKKDKTLDKWFRKARTDVFINIDPAFSTCNILD
jgi:peptidyl-prolyl cis-trans isomerase SurA